MDESLRSLDSDALALFAKKGMEGGPGVPQAGPINGVKVRRVLQITRDLAQRPFPELALLDVGCGEGVYAIEAGLRGARVVAIDARTTRMAAGAACATRHGLANVRFEQQDVRRVTRATHGAFDVVYCLGLLYHLDAPDVFDVLEHLHELCTGFMIVDTVVSTAATLEWTHRGKTYSGERCREHASEDPAALRESRALKSIDNEFSIRFTRESLVRVLNDVGFTSVFGCDAPLEPGRAADRVTLVAVNGEPVALSTYPWVNGKSESEIAEHVRGFEAGAQ